jgi:KipI family sensor histidine kinase inhibitor
VQVSNVPESSSNPSPPKFLDAGDSAVIVEFGRVVDVALHDRVLALDAAVTAAKIDGVTETVPTYRSLMIYYDARSIERDQIIARVEKLLAQTSSVLIEPKVRTIPVCYAPPHAEDLAEVAQHLNLSQDRIIDIFTNTPYRVYMFGFLPGFAYLGRLPEAIGIPRRATPRSPAQTGAVLIAAEQVVITGVTMTTGWYMIGRTPLRVFDLARESPFIFDVGDEVRFEPIDNATFERLQSGHAK